MSWKSRFNEFLECSGPLENCILGGVGTDEESDHEPPNLPALGSVHTHGLSTGAPPAFADAEGAGSQLWTPDQAGLVSPSPNTNQLPLSAATGAMGFDNNQSEEDASLFDSIEDMRAHWSGPQKCQRPNCATKATLTTPPKLFAHILNIHLEPLVCDVSGCTHQKPFSRVDDLRRHQVTRHGAAGERPYRCSDGSCPSHSIGFVRLDNLRVHVKNQHGGRGICGERHCNQILFESKEQHEKSQHGDLECRLGSCRLMRWSNFSRLTLECHLCDDHGVKDAEARACVSTFVDSFFFKENHLKGFQWKDCRQCAAKTNPGRGQN